MLTTFYLAKNDHRWVTFICLKTIKVRRGLRTAKTGRPRDYTEVHGYDRTIYNGGHAYPRQDVANVSGVFAGWSPSFSFYHGLKLSAILSARISWEKEVISASACDKDQSIQSPHSTFSQLLSYALYTRLTTSGQKEASPLCT